MDAHFLSGPVMLCIQQSHYVGRTTMSTHLLCSLPKKLLPTRSRRVLTVHHPQCPHAQCIIEMTARKGLCETECGCQNFPKLKSCSIMLSLQLETSFIFIYSVQKQSCYQSIDWITDLLFMTVITNPTCIPFCLSRARVQVSHSYVSLIHRHDMKRIWSCHD